MAAHDEQVEKVARAILKELGCSSYKRASDHWLIPGDEASAKEICESLARAAIAAMPKLAALVAERREISMALGNQPDEPITTAELIEQIERISRIAGKGSVEKSALVAERDALREALEEIAKQVPAKDMDEDYYEAADFEDGYDRCVFAARAALAQGGKP